MGDLNNPTSILETYIQAQKDKFDQEQTASQNASQIANRQADTEFRQKQAKQLDIQLETEHKRRMAELDAQQAQIEASRAQIAHAHLQSKMDILKGVQEGTIPVPQQQFTQDGNLQVQPGGPADQVTNIPQGSYVKPPLTFDGTTLQPNEYNSAAEAVRQTQPLVNSEITNKAKLAELTAQGTEQGKENVNRQPGGLYDQQRALEQNKLDNALKIADVTATRAETVANINSAARKEAARINGQARITAAGITKNTKQIDPDALEERMTELNYGEGKPLGTTPLDMAAASGLRTTGKVPVLPKTVENIKAIKPLENLSADMTDFANKYLGDGALSGLANAAKLNAPITSDEKNAYNQLLLSSTNIAKAVEGATGRILMAQIQVAKDFLSNKNIDRKQLLANAKKLNETLVTAVEGQLGNMKPKDRIDLLDHYGFNTIAAYAAKRWKVAEPGIPVAPEQTLPTKLDSNWKVLGQQ